MDDLLDILSYVVHRGDTLSPIAHAFSVALVGIVVSSIATSVFYEFSVAAAVAVGFGLAVGDYIGTLAT
jgi:hypothetical protein